MSAPRLAATALLLLSACAGWDSSTPTYAQPPVESPTPSHHAPQAPEAEPVVTAEAPVEPSQPPAAPMIEPGEAVAIASVILLDDCPEPAPTAAPEAASQLSQAKRKPSATADADFAPGCQQSTVQVSLRSDRAGSFRIHAVRVLDAASKRVAGTATLRQPSRWNEADGTYTAWDERVVPGPAVQTTYKLGALDLSKANKRGGPRLDVSQGPFLLELDVSIDGRRRTVRSSEFGREDPHMVVT